MKKAILLSALFIFCSFSAIIASDNEAGFSLTLLPEIGERFKEIFQAEKYAEAEALYLATVDQPDKNWLTLLKTKQGKIDEGMEYLKRGIEMTKSPDERKVAIKRALGLVNSVSPEIGIRFLNEYGKEIEVDIDVVCFRARYHMFRGEI